MSNEKINKNQEFEPVGETKGEKKNILVRSWEWVKNNPWKTTGIVAVGVTIGVMSNDKSRNAVIGGVKAGASRVRGMVKKQPKQIEGVTVEQKEAPVAEGMTSADKPQYEGGRERRNFRGDFNNRFERNFNNNNQNN